MKKIFIYLVFIQVFIAACNNGNEKSTSPAYKSLTEAVYASGNIYPKNEYRLTANADGFLIRQTAFEGDLVTRNQLIFQLESISQDARLEAAGNILRQSETNYGANSPVLAELTSQLQSARTKLANDSVNYFRQKELYDRNATTRVEYERAELAYQTSKTEITTRQKALQRTRSQLYVDLQNSQSNFRVNAREGDNYRIKTFEAGKIYEIYKKQGELVRRGEQIALIGDANEIYAQLAIDEGDFSKVKPGQEVLVKIDVYKNKVFKARVTKLYPKLNKADQTFRVDAEFVGEKPNAYYGMTLEGNIIISQNPRVLTIPKTYLVGNDSVWIEENGDKKKVKITKGVENLDLVEVKGGLNEKSIVTTGN
ncbi:efflux RND transporter periplasmic adaptor subunit [Emticicia sp. 21SJ11W-3]|uniref:efflux RND transporter periplasmic adaptor subunit n=1 Tax=Emticicia sp. 21SJ11W-3 TaxID=2916755 RepID=UPI00209DCCAB|nr:HlyD family efflux transporter periplasmic adaptor subunit [Emticicia sp. 21SJ11W-3]UTA67883.1 efflux RND transporter periplasmic adaptor subunit [Emticicia sp. 21SJ11W-3]